MSSRLKAADAEALDRGYLSDRVRRVARHLLPQARILTRQNMEVLAKNRGTSRLRPAGSRAFGGEPGGKASAHDGLRGPLDFAFLDAARLSSGSQGGKAAKDDAAKEMLTQRLRELAAGMSSASGRKLIVDKAALLWASPETDATEAMLRALDSHQPIEGFDLSPRRGGIAYADVQRIVQEVAEGKEERTRLKVVDKASLLYAPASSDLTTAVIRRYNDRFTKN